MKRIPLSGKRGEGLFVLVDDEDYERVREAGSWWLNIDENGRVKGAMTTIYKADGTRTNISMHKFITGYVQTDHIDGDVLNNQRYNLRPTYGGDPNTPPRKGSSSKYKGVSKEGSKWRAQISKGRNGSRHSFSLGRFTSEIDAAIAYDKAAREVHEEFAWLNCEHFEEVPC